MLVDHVDEGEGVGVKAEVGDPLAEGVVLLLHLLYERGEESLHLFLHQVHLRDLGVWVLADDVLQLTPQHLLAFLVK